MALVRAARPRQWAKNVLLLAAPGAAGVLHEPAVLASVAVAVVAFCLVASGTYLVNDARDVEADRRHPVKRRRPVAAGLVPSPMALSAGFVALSVGLSVAAAVSWAFFAVVAAYVALTTAYTLGLKRVAVVDIAVVASGFILRAVGGGVAAGVPLSRWFLIVTSFGALFVVAGKRHGEQSELGEAGGSIRSTLGQYTPEYLRYVWTLSSGVAVTAYCLWAFEQGLPGSSVVPWYELSVVPFVLFVLRYAHLVSGGAGSAPEDVLLGDRTLQVVALAWVLVFAGGVYLGR